MCVVHDAAHDLGCALPNSLATMEDHLFFWIREHVSCGDLSAIRTCLGDKRGIN